MLPTVVNPGQFRFDPKLLNASGAEKALNVGAVAGNIAGQVPTSAWKKIGKGALKVFDFIFTISFIVAMVGAGMAV